MPSPNHPIPKFIKFPSKYLRLKTFSLSLQSQWGISSVGRAFEWHSKGQEFDSPMLHFPLKHRLRINELAFRIFFRKAFLCLFDVLKCDQSVLQFATIVIFCGLIDIRVLDPKQQSARCLSHLLVLIFVAQFLRFSLPSDVIPHIRRLTPPLFPPERRYPAYSSPNRSAFPSRATLSPIFVA